MPIRIGPWGGMAPLFTEGGVGLGIGEGVSVGEETGVIAVGDGLSSGSRWFIVNTYNAMA